MSLQFFKNKFEKLLQLSHAFYSGQLFFLIGNQKTFINDRKKKNTRSS